MARHHEADRICRVGAAHRSRRAAQLGGELSVAARFAEGDRAQQGPDAVLERRTGRRELNGEIAKLARKVGEDLFACGFGALFVWNQPYLAGASGPRRQSRLQPGRVTEGCGNDGPGFVDGETEVGQAKTL